MSRFRALVEEAKTRVSEMEQATLCDKLARKEPLCLIDVRERDNWEKGHITGAQHLEKGVLELKIEEMAPDPETEIVLYCGGGSRAALAAESLQRMGYKRVASLAGGFRGWKAAKLPVDGEGA